MNTDRGAAYGITLVWDEKTHPGMGEILADVQDDLDQQKFYREYIELMTRPTPGAKDPSN